MKLGTYLVKETNFLIFVIVYCAVHNDGNPQKHTDNLPQKNPNQRYSTSILTSRSFNDVGLEIKLVLYFLQKIIAGLHSGYFSLT